MEGLPEELCLKIFCFLDYKNLSTAQQGLLTKPTHIFQESIFSIILINLISGLIEFSHFVCGNSLIFLFFSLVIVIVIVNCVIYDDQECLILCCWNVDFEQIVKGAKLGNLNLLNQLPFLECCILILIGLKFWSICKVIRWFLKKLWWFKITIKLRREESGMLIKINFLLCIRY